LLRRWGVVFRDLLVKESGAPPWWELVQIYRRLEARGEIRGGRFVAGVGGEQYALEESIAGLRQIRDATAVEAERLIVSAADPLNLSGIVVDGPRVPALGTNALAFCDGRLIAYRLGDEVQFQEELEPVEAERVTQALRRDAPTRQAAEG